MFEKFTEDARRALFFARDEAVRRGAGTIEPAHFLLGILHLAEVAPLLGLADTATLEILRGEFAHTVPAGPGPERLDMPLAHPSKRILAYAVEESERMGHRTITSAHLLLGIHRENLNLPSPEALFLNEHGADYKTLRDRVKGLGGQG